tara:strand:- start:479 stop:832 length:354 start_codon:yes stop_codon:yes gene_type:complete
MKRLLLTLIAAFIFPIGVNADDPNFINIKCKEDGTMNQMAQCLYDQLSKEDRALRKEFNNDELWKLWLKARRGVCNHIKERQFREGSIRPVMKATCELRLNSEMQKFCVTAKDKECG